MHRYARSVAIDLGKFNPVLCAFGPATAAHTFASFGSDRQTMHDRLAEHATADPAQTLVVFETRESAGGVHDVATGLRLAVAVANPADEARRWTKVKRKTHRDDALKLAKMADPVGGHGRADAAAAQGNPAVNRAGGHGAARGMTESG
jgi:transposase